MAEISADRQVEIFRQGLLDLSNLYEIAAEAAYHQQIEHGDVCEFAVEGAKMDLYQRVASKLDELARCATKGEELVVFSKLKPATRRNRGIFARLFGLERQ